MLRRVMVLLVLGSMLLAACGGDDGGGSNGGSDGGSDGDGGNGAIGGIATAECAEVAAALAAAAQGTSAAVSGSTDDLDDAVQQMEAFADAAPEEIADALATIAEGYRAVAEVFANAGFDPASGEVPPPEVIAELEQATQDLNSEEFQAAVEQVNAYFQGGCEG